MSFLHILHEGINVKALNSFQCHRQQRFYLQQMFMGVIKTEFEPTSYSNHSAYIARLADVSGPKIIHVGLKTGSIRREYTRLNTNPAAPYSAQ
jgi:hypothetical protein